MLDVRRMRVLREVALRGSFSAAAEALSFTQSAVSQQIAALEREAGAVLVERSARGVRLTEAGEAVVRHADQILGRLAEAEAELEAIAGLRGGRLRMAAFESAAATIMPVAIAAFAKVHPAVELSMTLLEPEESVAALRAGDIDLAVTFGAGKPEDRFGDGVEHHHLLEDPMYLVLSQDHPLARKRGVRLADLAGEPWIGGAPDCECNRLISQACMRFGFDPRIAFETDDYAAVQGFVAAGVGVSLIAELGLRTLRDDIVVRPLGRDTPVRQIYATALTGYRSPATVAMIDLLREVGAEHAAGRPQLDALAEGPAGVNALARRIEVNPSSASRLLATLERGGLVEREPGGPYRLGLHILALADRVLSRLDVREPARAQLRALVEQTGETATLSVPDGDQAVTVDFVPGGASVVSMARLGRPSIGHATATGKLLLALTGAEPRALTPVTERTITDPERLAAELAAVREQGWAEAEGE